MKGFFSRNKKGVEIFLTLALVFTTAGYYYLIYIPEKENEIIERRFRTLQKVEENSLQKVQGYIQTIKLCAYNLDSIPGGALEKFYNKDPDKFRIEIDTLKDKKEIAKDTNDENSTGLRFKMDNNNKDIISLSISKDNKDKQNSTEKSAKVFQGIKFHKDTTGRNLIIEYDTIINKFYYKLKAIINYREFIKPLLRENVFDHYIVFNDSKNIYEDFPSGFSFDNIDSLFSSRDKIYSSRIVKIETGGQKYLAFLHPCGYSHKNDRIIAGLLSQKAFDKEKRKLPENIVTTILFIALFSLLLIPILKLALMGKKERISISDLLFNYISMMLLISVILLLFFRYNNNFLPPDKADKDLKSKKILASQISKSLNREIESAYNFLSDADRYYYDSLPVQNVHVKNLNQGAKGGFFSKKVINVSTLAHLDTFVDSLQYKNAFRIAWINSIGKVVTYWSFFEDAPGGSLKGRDYFKSISENKTLSLFQDTAKQYFIEPVVSWNDGMFRVIISKRSHIDTLITAVSCNFTSVVNPVLPLGYSFAITDTSGKVIFHSDSTHILNENLTQEFIDPDPLKIALQTKTQQKFTTDYEEHQYSILVQPIERLPYFIVIFYRDAYTVAQNTECFSFTFTMLLSLFLFICIEMLVIFLCYCRHSKLLKNKFDFSWLHPLKSCSVKYYFVFLFNTGLFIILFIFCIFPYRINLVGYILLFLISSVLSSIVSCLVQPIEKNSASDASNKNAIQSITLERYKKPAIVSLIILAVIVLSASFKYSVPGTVILFTSASIVLFAVLYLTFKEKLKIKSDRYLINFRLMVFSKLLLTSSIPIAVFFICSYNFEGRLNARLKLFNYAEKIQQKVANGESLKSLVDQIDTSTFKNFYTDAEWIHRVYIDTNPNQLPYAAVYDTIDSVCISLLKSNRVHYNDISMNNENFDIIKPFENDSEFVFNSIFSKTSDTLGDTLKYKISEIKNGTARQKYVTLVSSGSMKYNVPIPSITNLTGLIFWLFLSGCGVLVYQLIKYSSVKIYGLNIPEIDAFRKANDKLILNKDIKRLFVQGMPGSAKTEYLRTVLHEKANFIFDKKNAGNKNNVFLFDLIQIPDEREFEKKEGNKKENTPLFELIKISDEILFKKQKGIRKIKEEKENKEESEIEKWNRKEKELYDEWIRKDNESTDGEIKCIIFNHFEYKILDEHTNRIKFNLLEKFMLAQKENKIIISSNIDPVEFIRSLKKYELAPAAKKENGSAKKEERGSPANDGAGQYENAVRFENVHRWTNMLGMFTNVYADPDQCDAKSIGKESGFQFINDECRRNVNLVNIRNDFNKYITYNSQILENENWNEDCILKLQSFSEHSYRYIWSSLTHEEQLALYDLAEDGLMNTTNYVSLTMLLNKGLIRRTDGMFAMMNRSFRNFVLTIVTSNEIKNIEKEISDGQTWNDYKYPVMIILGALLWFVLSSNPEKFGNVLPVITGVMAGIPTILKLLSYMKPGEAKS